MTAKNSNKYMFFLIIYQLIFAELFKYLPIMELPFSSLLIINQVILFIVPFIFYMILTKSKITDFLLLNKISLFNLFLIVLLAIFSQPAMMFLSALSMLFFENNVSNVMTMLYDQPLPLLLITIAVTPAICEELTFRGVILSGYKKIDMKQAALINGLLFGIMHLDPQQFLYAFALGSVFYVLVYYTKSIFASVTAHFAVNASQATMAYFSLKAIENMDTSSIEVINESLSNGNEELIALGAIGFLTILTLPFFIGILHVFINHNKKNIVADEIQQDDEENSENPIDIFLILTVVIYIVLLFL